MSFASNPLDNGKNEKNGRSLTFGDVLVRVDPNFKLPMHLDTYEANAAEISTGMVGFLDSIQDRK